ncbi:hypothetical protein LINPERPRIM_LOCUS4507, partial [Linum perenne]
MLERLLITHTTPTKTVQYQTPCNFGGEIDIFCPRAIRIVREDFQHHCL